MPGCRRPPAIPRLRQHDRGHDEPARPPEPEGDAAKLIARHAPRARGGGHLPPPRRRLSRRAGRQPEPRTTPGHGAIEACRTAPLGGHVERCEDCGMTRIAYNSCRNRHCPKCQGLARAQWLADRHAELLPVPYFHLVFTLPRRSPPSRCRTRRSSTTPCSGRRPRRCRRSPPIQSISAPRSA